MYYSDHRLLQQHYDHLQRDDRLDFGERSSGSAVALLQRLHHLDLPALLVNCELVLVVSLKYDTFKN